MRILMPSIIDPVVAKSGAATVTRGLLRLLESPPLGASVRCVPLRQATGPRHRLRQGLAIIRSLASALPAKVTYTVSATFLSAVLDQLRRSAFDLVMVNGSDLLWLTRYLPVTTPRLLVAHNLEHVLFASQGEGVASTVPVLRPLIERERRRMERFETAGIAGVGNCVFLSSEDAAHPRGGALAARSIVIPPVFIEPPLARAARSPGGEQIRLGFIGNMNWWPNRRGLAWFLREVFPRLGGRFELHLFGHGTRELGDQRAHIVGHGPATDVRAVWSGCDLMICPMHWGGGVSTKLAEAVYHGVPTVTSVAATRGLPLGDDPSLVVLDSAAEWVDFLTSPRVRAVAARPIASALAAPFTPAAQLERAQRFVRETVSPEPARVAVM